MKAFGIGILIGAALLIAIGVDSSIAFVCALVGIGFIIASSSGSSKHTN